jgi:uncharacterized protein YsxB (DUF464 family)
MTTATFFAHDQKWTGVTVSGHAGFADEGYDIICASISASVQMAANLLTEVYHLPASVVVEEESISISVASITDENASLLLQGLYLQLQLLEEEAPDCLQVRTASTP